MTFLFVVTLVMLLAACGPSQPGAVPTKTPLPPATALPGPTAVPTAIPGVLYVNPAQDLGPISPFVYGSNYGPGMLFLQV